MPEKKASWWPLTLFLIITLVIWAGGFLISQSSSVQRTYSEFLKDLEEGRITSVEISETQIIGTLATPAPEGESRVVAVRPPNLDDPRLLRLLTERNVSVKGQNAGRTSWVAVIGWLLPVLLLFFVIAGGARAARQASMNNSGSERAVPRSTINTLIAM